MGVLSPKAAANAASEANASPENASPENVSPENVFEDEPKPKKSQESHKISGIKNAVFP